MRCLSAATTTGAVLTLSCLIFISLNIRQTAAETSDYCTRHEILALLLGGLHKTPGMEDAEFENITTTYVSAWTGISSRLFSCHGTLIFRAGRSLPGTISISRAATGQLQAAWLADADKAKQQVQTDQSARKQPWHGDIGTWTGIPPLPPTASETKTAIASTRCSVGSETVGIVERYMSSSDCNKWIAEAQKLAATGPTPREIYQYRLSKCAEQLARQGTQAYSGQFMELCAGIRPHPIN